MKRAVPFVVIAVMIGMAPSARASDGPLDELRDAMETAAFSGELTVSWLDGNRLRNSSVTIRCDEGDVEFDGPVPIMKTVGSHFVRMSDRWMDLAPARDVAQPTTDRYDARRGPGPVIAGRTSELLEILDGDRLRERLAIDRELGVVLRREQFDDRGRLLRRIQFTSFEPGPPARDRVYPLTASEASDAVGADVPAPYRAPASLAGGYRRVGVFRHDGLVHVVYGDGMYGLSVFEQPGDLQWDQLPKGGRPISVGGHRGRSYVWPGGRLVTWQAGRSTFTVIGDGLPSEILAAAASLRSVRSLSVGQRLRQTARELVETLSGG